MNPLSDDELRERLAALQTAGSFRQAAAALGISSGALQFSVDAAARRGITTATPHEWTYPKVRADEVRGTVLVGSDLHGWPGVAAPMWDAFLELAHRLSPDMIVMNGDVLDGARISRHPRRRLAEGPKISAEIAVAKQRLGELPVRPRKRWPIGNHEQRVDAYVAQSAPEMEDCALDLRREFPEWGICYGLLLNDAVEVRHRWHKGIHAAYNNALRSGVSYVTGDTHRLIATPVESRRGRAWGVETGMLADPGGPQFEYTEGQPTRWTSGFVVLTFDDEGQMLPPELCEWHGGRAWFRGAPVLRSARVSVREKSP